MAIKTYFTLNGSKYDTADYQKLLQAKFALEGRLYLTSRPMGLRFSRGRRFLVDFEG
jgi:hypothetical protein